MPRPIVPIRLPLDGVNPFDADEVRTWFQAHLDEVIPLQGQPTPAIHLLYDGHREVIELPTVLASDPSFHPAATYAALAARPDVRSAVLVAMLESGEGARAALLVSVEHERGKPSAWWACWRGYDMTPDGIGSFTSDWEEGNGEGPPPQPFASLVVGQPGAVAAAVAPGQPPDPDLRAAFLDLPESVRLPTSAQEMTEFVAASLIPEVLQQGLDHPRIYRLQGRAWEVWKICGSHLPSSLTDLVRTVCQYGEPAEAVALVTTDHFVEDGETLKAVRIVAELGAGWAERIFTFRLPPGATKHVSSKTHWRERPRDPERGWLGVEPMMSGSLYMKPPLG